MRTPQPGVLSITGVPSRRSARSRMEPGPGWPGNGPARSKLAPLSQTSRTTSSALHAGPSSTSVAQACLTALCGAPCAMR